MTPNELRALRKSKQLTVKAAGELCGMTDMGYRAYEDGKRKCVLPVIIDAITTYEPPPIEGDDNSARMKRYLREHEMTVRGFAAMAGITRMDAVKIHSHADYLPGKSVHARCLAVGLDLHRSTLRAGWSPDVHLNIPEAADTEQARTLVAYMREHRVSMAEVARRIGSTQQTVSMVVNGGRPRRGDIRATFAAVGVTWPDPSRPVRIRQERKPRPAPAPKPPKTPKPPKPPRPKREDRPRVQAIVVPRVRWITPADTEQARALDAWARTHQSPAHAATALRVDLDVLIRTLRGAKPRNPTTRDKLARIGVVWEEPQVMPVAAKNEGQCACGAVLTRNRSVTMDGVRMCSPCHRKFWRME